MSWIHKLYETYENCQSMIGGGSDEEQVPLLPICHTTQKAHIEIVIDQEGNFRRARVIPKNEARTIIPCTEKSGGRTSGEAAHPLCDKLQYVAGDYVKYGGGKKHYFKSYKSELKKWCNSSFSHPKAIAVLKYVKKGTVIQDLVQHQVLFIGNDNKFLKERSKKKGKNAPPDIYNVAGSQDEAFIRWVVETPGSLETAVWQDESLWDSWTKYYSSTKSEKTLCYVAGKEVFSADQHPAKLRNDGDKAKLISSNDLSGFTFRGRFITAGQACGVGFETTQKAHYALRWLINRQGYKKGDQAIVAWATSGSNIPSPTHDAVSILGENDLPSDECPTASTAQELAIKLRNRIAGYSKELGDTTGIVVMALDSATPGRMGITYYRELTGSDFLKRIENWHESCAWIHDYRYIDVRDDKSNTKKRKYLSFVGAPAPGDIAEAAYGSKVDDKLRKSTVKRILPCIIDGQQIPRDLVESAVRRASNRIGMEDWEWNKTLSIACALYRKYNRKENYDMALDLSRKTRDYLYGRLLAIADRLEEHALYKAKEKRATNAARYMQRFAYHPNKTWMQIYLSLLPYMARLGGAKYYKDLMDEVKCKFDPIEDFNSDKPLSGEFLLAYHCQRAAFWAKDDAELPVTQSNTDETVNKQ